MSHDVPAAPLEWLNYHHLLYFWTVVREGGISKAAARLRLSQPTVSAQVRQLEEAFGERLLQRQGRGVALTDAGRLVHRYADEIFGLGRELQQTLKGRAVDRPRPLAVGVANAVPKLVVARLLTAALTDPALHVICREDNTDRLLAALAVHDLDVVIADTPAPPHVRVRVFNHALGESPTTVFAPPALAARLRRRFPRSLAGAPMLLPASNTALRRALDAWFEQLNAWPRVVAEFEDSALMKACAASTGAAFPAPSAIADEIRGHYGVRVAGRTDAVRETYYAISAERRVKHPGVLAITGAARGVLPS